MGLNKWLKQCSIVAILRGIRPDEVESICSTLEESGIAIVEVPLNSPDPLNSIGILARIFGDRMLVGAGTVTDPKQITDIAAAGGKLIVTPHAEVSIVRAAKAAGMIAMPGFFNPTEAFSLLQAGADAIKLFPAEVVGIPMMKAIQAVLPQDTRIIPVGGMDAKNIPEWMAAGAAGVGVGSSVYKPGDDAATVKKKAELLVNAVRSAGFSNLTI